MDNNETEDVVEEDWSAVMSETTAGFAQHDTASVRVSLSQSLIISCVPSLSPLDMMNLSLGKHDATGHRIWLGAYFFVEVMVRNDHLKNLFRCKQVLELGCGSGVSGLVVVSTCDPESILLTDSDNAALDLCTRNCQRNLPANDKRYSIACLDWGDSNASFDDCFDTVLATDVIYDISSLSPIMHTVWRALKQHGHFVMAHVPRASLPGEAKVGTEEQLECFVVTAACKCGLQLKMTVRPDSLWNEGDFAPLNNVSFQEMEEAGRSCDSSV